MGSSFILGFFVLYSGKKRRNSMVINKVSFEFAEDYHFDHGKEMRSMLQFFSPDFRPFRLKHMILVENHGF